MKQKINKTIITKKGGTIVIPNKIIGKEYPDNKNKNIEEPEFYYVKILNFKDLLSYGKMISHSVSSNIYTIEYQFSCLPGKKVFKVDSLYEASCCLLCYNTINNIKSNQSFGFVNQVATVSGSYNNDITELIFIAYKNIDIAVQGLKAIIENLSDDVEYETNFQI